MFSFRGLSCLGVRTRAGSSTWSSSVPIPACPLPLRLRRSLFGLDNVVKVLIALFSLLAISFTAAVFSYAGRFDRSMAIVCSLLLEDLGEIEISFQHVAFNFFQGNMALSAGQILCPSSIDIGFEMSACLSPPSIHVSEVGSEEYLSEVLQNAFTTVVEIPL